MLNQGMVQETLADLSNPGALPPLNNLPQWSRINTLDKARYPKPFLKDRFAPLPSTTMDKRSDSLDSDDRDLTEEVEPLQNPQIRIQHLEKSLNFLTSQHHEILDKLHNEIDGLKRENKELQFKIVMVSRNSPPNTSSKKERKSGKSRATASGSSHIVQSAGTHMEGSSANINSRQRIDEQSSHVSDDKMEELKLIFLEEELKEVKKAIKDEKTKNHYLQTVLEAQQKHRGTERKELAVGPAPPASMNKVPTDGGATATGDDHDQEGEEEPQSASLLASVPLPFNATIDPLLVHLPNKPPRPPSLAECQIILRHLQNVNDKQAHELGRLKTDLRDVLYSHKWSPDAYLLAKAYIAADDELEGQESRLPRIPMKHPTRKLPDLAYMQKDALSLPALKQTMGNKATERRKRTQILQKAKMRREVPSFLLH